MNRAEVTKRKIIDSTIELIAEKGYAATSSREIAKKAGISEATIFKYYDNKDNLLNIVVETIIQDFLNYSFEHSFPKLLSENKSIQDMLQNILIERLTFFKENSNAFQVIIQEMMINPSIRELFIERVWVKLESISNDIFEKGKNEGVFRDIDNFFLQKALFGMLFYTNIFEKILNIQSEKYSIKKQADMILDILLNGISK
ncbi:TetR/AcrR family transcriptional regulator [Caldisalinibacter kiritimatiensis]|uniref:Transcriptional regulator, TetR family n=1 Tax=Caldisalinibacter kiritimatiensis TaxID=1304284 RepID=R1AU54_9FIRM|nr:TetR/AcrR family transcriptional regulator [Caldisalinibacter kiritimatiensis]EOD00202.1 Transcriptional regulator, TetR family [Caldisalinibacter kiritimatiensis]